MPLTPHQLELRQKVTTYMQLHEVPCLCGATEGWDLQTRDRFDFGMGLRLCTACGVLRTDPRPTPESLERFYREDYRPLYSPAGVEDIWSQQLRQGQQALHYLRALQPRVVMDVGTGCGGNLKPFYDAGCTVYGCDYDPEYLAYGREQMPGATLVEGPATELPAGQADVVIAWHTLEHRPDWEACLAEHARLLKPNGVLWAQIPALSRIRDHYKNPNRYMYMPHVWHFTSRTFLWALRLHGFDGTATWEGTVLARHTGCGATPDRAEAVRTFREWCDADTDWRETNQMARMLGMVRKGAEVSGG